MANHPEPNNHPEHPDDSNPKTPPPHELSLGGSADLHAKSPTQSDSFIDLGFPAGPADPFASGPAIESHEASDASDASIVEWAALVEDAPADPGSSAAKFDRPSDQDWAAHGSEELTVNSPTTEKPATQHAIDTPELFADPAEIMADSPTLATAPTEPYHEALPSVPALTEEGSDELDSLAADRDVVRQTFNLDELDSHKNLKPPAESTDAMPVVNVTPEDEDVFEEVELAGQPGDSGSFSSSGVDLKQLDSNSFDEMVNDIAASAPKSSVDLGSAELPSAPNSDEENALDQPPSGRDLIAEAVESGVEMKQPLMEIVEEETLAEEQALEAVEVVESGTDMKQPLMEIVEEEEALEASEVVESSGAMKQPLMEIVEDEPAAVSEVVEEDPSAVVDLGSPAKTETLSREEMDALLAGQEMGAAADQPIQAENKGDEPPAKPDSPRKTVVAGRHPVRTTQMQDLDFDDEGDTGAAASEPGKPAKPDARKTRVAGRGPVRTTQVQGSDFEDVVVDSGLVAETTAAAEAPADVSGLVEQEIASGTGDAGVEEVVDAGVLFDENLVGEEVAAAPSSDVIVEDAAKIVDEPAMDSELAVTDTSDLATIQEGLKAKKLQDELVAAETSALVEEPVSEVSLGAASEYSEDVSEIELKPDHPVLDSSAHLEELADTGSGVLLDKLKGHQGVDPEEVQLGEPGTAEDDETLAASDKTDHPKSTKPEKPKKGGSGALAFVGGGFLGTMAGVGACVALYFSGLLGPTTTITTVQPQTQPNTNTPAPVTFQSKLAELRNGNLDKADLEKIDETKPEELAARGDFRMLKYLNGQAKGKDPVKVNKDDPLITGAVADLTKASQNPDNKAAAAEALLHLAQIQELAGDDQGALKAYQEGAAKYKDDPKLARMFDAAVNRLSSRNPAAPGVGRLLDPQRPLEEQAFVLAMLLCLQPPMEPAGDADDEAGFKFWLAVNAMKKANTPEEIKAARDLLQAARALHDKRRFAQLRKSQNPLSDPTEEIFLRACDQLNAYWLVQEKVRGGGYLTAEAALTDLTKIKLEKKQLEDDNKKLADDKTKAETAVVDLNKVLADQKKTAETEIAALKKTNMDEKKAAETEIGAMKAASAKLAMQLQAEKDAVKSFREQLTKAKFIDDKADNPRVLEGLSEAIKLASMKDPQGEIRKLNNDLSEVRATLKDRWEPKDMLAIWLPVLESRPAKEVVDRAMIDAERVLKDAKATPQEKARAEALKGLNLRNEEKFAEAKTKLEEAKKGLGEGALWLKPVNEALAEVSNPTATYLARADRLRAKGDYGAALAALTKTIDTLPVDQRVELLAERSLLRLEEIRAKHKGPLLPEDDAVKEAQEDAKKAAAAGVPQGFYALGRIAEESGQWQVAVAEYRKAVEATPEIDARSSRYRVALARALLESRGKVAPPEKPKDENKVGRLPALDGANDPQTTVAVLVALTLQPPLLPAASEEEAMKLADDVLKANKAKPGTVPFDVVAQAYAIKGLYTEALKTFAEGLRPHLPPEYSSGLMLMIEINPALRRPESMKIANPLNAERHYGAGLRWYYERNYPNAEQEFLEAIRNDNLDARYFYFLGLARLAQRNRDAYEDFAAGAKLELQERPSRAAVSTALERVQGPMREELNGVRRSITLPTGK